MSQAFESYKMFHALRLHFKSKSYDFVKFRGKTRVSAAAFDKRNDRFFYYKLSARYKKELQGFYVSALTESTEVWVGDLLDDSWNDKYNGWLGRNQALFQTFKGDCATLGEFRTDRDVEFVQLLRSVDGDLPALVRLQIQGFISLETCVIINNLTKFTDKVNVINPLWDDRKLLLTKYSSFVKVAEPKRYATLLKDTVT